MIIQRGGREMSRRGHGVHRVTMIDDRSDEEKWLYHMQWREKDEPQSCKAREEETQRREEQDFLEETWLWYEMGVGAARVACGGVGRQERKGREEKEEKEEKKRKR